MVAMESWKQLSVNKMGMMMMECGFNDVILTARLKADFNYDI